MPTNIKWKMQACFVLYFKFWEGTSVKSYKLQLPVLLSIVLQLFRTLLNIIWKRFLCQAFLFNRFTQTKAPLWPKSATLLCLIVEGGGVNKMRRGENYQWSWGLFFPKVCSLTPPTIKHKRVSVTIVCTTLSSEGGVGWGVEAPTKFSKREGAWQELNF